MYWDPKGWIGIRTANKNRDNYKQIGINFNKPDLKNNNNATAARARRQVPKSPPPAQVISDTILFVQSEEKGEKSHGKPLMSKQSSYQLY